MGSVDDVLTVEEVAERTGVSVATVRRRAQSGSLRAEKVGRQWLIRADGVTRRRATGPRRATMPRVDLGAAMRHLRSRDLIEVWVPDILAFEDLTADPTEVMAAASQRLASAGPFDPVEEVEFPKSAFFSRPAALLSLEDRLAYHGAVASITPRIEALLSPNVYSARLSVDKRYFLINGRDQWLAWKAAVEQDIADGYSWMIKTDVTAYFDNIEHRLLFGEIDGLNPDPAVAAALKRMLATWSSVPGRGIPQGPDASRVLGNLYFLPVDDVMSAGPWRYRRYMDDIRVLGLNRADAIAGIRALERECRRRGLVLSAHKTSLLVGDHAARSESDPELDQARYWVEVGYGPEARRRLRKLLKASLANAGVVNERHARFSLWRLRALRDHFEIRLVLDNLERLAPVAPIAVQYLRPFLERRRVLDGIATFLSDPERNTSEYVSAWVLSLILESKTVPAEVSEYARRVCHDRNEPVYHRAVAANVLALGRRRTDLVWLGKAADADFDPALLRGYVVALARVGALDRDVTARTLHRAPELSRTVDYLKGRTTLPSLIYRSMRVSVPT